MDNTIFISDLHFPHQHQDALRFLGAVKDEYDIEIAKSVGDIVDNHNASYHEIEYGIRSPKDEYRAARKNVQELAKIFPDLTVSLGNHDILTARKAKTAGISADHLKSYNDVYGVEWDWVDKDYFKINKDLNCLMVHTMSGNTLTNAKVHSHSCVQGHHHSLFGIEYFADTEVIRWAMTVGCLIDPHSPAFNYAKGATVKRPILGCGGLVDDSPFLIPMNLTKSGRWNGKL